MRQFYDAGKLTAGTAELRRWQEEAMDIVIPDVLASPLLVEACPGAGKTHFGLEVAYRLLLDDQISRVLVNNPK